MNYTEEEKKAINDLKYLLKRRYEDEIETYNLFGTIETALNLIDKQQKEIERLYKIITEVERYARGIKDEELLLILKKDEIEKLVNECEELLGE